MELKTRSHLNMLLVVTVSAILLFLFPQVQSEAALTSGWFINPYKFHVSAHGAMSCQECHTDMNDQQQHPTPALVTKTTDDFFNPSQCEQCHDEIFSDLEEGVHGSHKGINVQKYSQCIRCHNVHYLLGKENGPNVDRTKNLRVQCGSCHKDRKKLPQPTEDDLSCWECHVTPPEKDAPTEVFVEEFCFTCHGEKKSGLIRGDNRSIPLLREEDYAETIHAEVACTVCHIESARFPHVPQKQGDCGSCHHPHHEKVIHDYHGMVTCQACHLSNVHPVKKPGAFKITWEIDRSVSPLQIHDMTARETNERCAECHFPGNTVGASSITLPSKSIICMPCHTSTFSIGDTVTVITLILFGAGFISVLCFWLSGTVDGVHEAGYGSKAGAIVKNVLLTVFSRKIGVLIKALFLDVLLLRRLYTQSPGRWLIHGLMFWPIIARFVWGLFCLLTSLYMPDRALPWIMIDKNHPLTALFFDATGACIILGVILAVIRGATGKSHVPEGMGQDRTALSLLGGAIIMGFIVEGMRMAMTDVPASVGHYAFLGYLVSALLKSTSMQWNDIYGYVWYAHAIVWAAFVCYLPVSRMFHIIMAPVILMVNAVTGHGKRI